MIPISPTGNPRWSLAEPSPPDGLLSPEDWTTFAQLQFHRPATAGRVTLVYGDSSFLKYQVAHIPCVPHDPYSSTIAAIFPHGFCAAAGGLAREKRGPLTLKDVENSLAKLGFRVR